MAKRTEELLAELQSEMDAECKARELLRTSKRELRDSLSALHFVIEIAKTTQQQIHSRIASIVSKCLQAVFNEPYVFQISFERKRGRTEARLYFTRDGEPVDPMEASSGGVVDVAAFALRLACIVLSRPASRRLIVLDEPFKFVDAENRPRVRAMLEMLTEELDFQIVMTTHIPELQTGKVIEVK